MLFTEEHYELIKAFEREFNIKNERAAKESKELWKQGHVFCHGETNELFLAYRKGTYIPDSSDR